MAAPSQKARSPGASGSQVRLRWGVQTFALMLVFVGVLTSLGAYQVWHRHHVYAMARDLSTETLRYRSLLDQSRRLKLELATLKRVERVRKEASERLGMRVPAPQDVVEIR